MSVLDYFKSTPSITPDDVRALIAEKKPDEYCLLDVRQPAEYERGHIPGARLIPLSELAFKMGEMDRGRKTVVYCRSGSRSLSATGMLMGAGFQDVFNMDGGIMAYNGIVAGGSPEAGMFCFPESLSAGQLAAVAWFLEDGSIRFLEDMQRRFSSSDESAIFENRIAARNSHKQRLEKLYNELTGQAPSSDFPGDVIDVPAETIMVGCVKVDAALAWAADKTLNDILELMISLGANGYDLYLKLGRAVSSEDARKVFNSLSDEEQKNIEYIASEFEKTL
jgi:rhodanese-related sulfurtransferase/rubrerythrin